MRLAVTQLVARAALVAVLAVAACSGEEVDIGGGLVGGTSTSVSEATTTSSTTATTEPVPFEIEVKRAAIELLEIRNDVFQRPDVSRVSDYIAETCVCLERERGFIERFAAEGLRWSAALIQPRAVRVTVDDPSAPALTVVAWQPDADLIAIDGTVIEHSDESPAAAYRLVLARAGVEWRLNALEATVLNEATSAAVLREGLP